MNLRKLSILSSILLFLAGCVADGTLVPKKQGREEVNDIQITYILPKDIVKSDGTLNGLVFERFNSGDSVKMESLRYIPTPTGIEVHRRTDNTVAGSGIIYEVDVNISHKNNNTIVTLISKNQKSYQEGVILPFPVPAFSIEKYLSAATLNYQFEINSDYNVDSIKANFDRRLNSSRLEVEDISVDFSYKVYPYRNGSKVIINAKLRSHKSNKVTIDITQA